MQPIDWPNTANYFTFYQLPLVFDIDITYLRSKYFEYAKRFHPDFFLLDIEAQGKALEITSINNKAFKILNSPIARVQYLLELKEVSLSENSTLPQGFLMEMMELNEQIDELEIAENKQETCVKIQAEIEDTKATLFDEITVNANTENWQKAKENVLKWRYLERLIERVKPTSFS